MKLFQINEDDLSSLEIILPEVFDKIPSEAKESKESTEQIEIVKKIMSNIRWNYQPHTKIEEL